MLDKLPIIEVKGLKFHYRPGSSDLKVIKEVVEKHIYSKGFRDLPGYKFDILPGENWLDLGANIGTFSVWALSKGASVWAYEPEDLTYQLLLKNLQLNGVWAYSHQMAVVGNQKREGILSLGKQGSEWRHTLMKKKSDVSQTVSLRNINDVFLKANFDGIKMDIEGAELEILDNIESFRNVKKMVFEYHLDIDDYVPNFFRRIDRLKKHFKEVRFAKVNPELEHYAFFPPSRIIYCFN